MLRAVDTATLQQLKQRAGQAEGRDKVALLQEVSEAYVADYDSAGLRYARQALSVAEDMADPDLITSSLNQLASVLIDLNRFEEAFSHLNKAESYFEKGVSGRERAITFWKTGKAHHLNADYSMAEFYFGKARDLVQNLEDKALEADIIADLADNYRYIGDYEEATTLNFEALRYYESVGDSNKIMTSKVALGIIDYLRGETNTALETFLENRAYHARRNDSMSLGLANTLLGLCYFQMKDFDASIRYSVESCDIRRRIDDQRGLGESLNNLALAYMGQKEWEKAGRVLEESLDLLTAGNDLRQIPIILGNIGDTKRQMKEYDEAFDYYNRALQQARLLGLRHSIASIYRKIFRLHRKLGDYKSAYRFQGRYTALRDSLFNEEKAKVISDLNFQYQTAQKEQEIEMLKQKQAAETRKRLLLGLILGSVVVVSLLVFSRQRLKIRNDKALHEKEKLILRAKEQLTEAELRNTRNELSFNKSILASHMENILQKNALIEQLESELKAMNLRAFEVDESRIEKVNELLHMKILTDDDWEIFKQHFEHVHTGLLFRLKEQFPSLTLGETRLFILLRLKLNSKEISNILGVSPDTVKKSRYRLRKKLQLAEGRKLQVFVDEFA